jgi:hypothetical protein
MIAIQTKYLPVTKTKSSRIKAWTSNGQSAIVPFNYDYDNELVHFQAVKALIAKHKLDWDLSGMRYGSTEGGYVFCFNHSIVKE